VALEWARRKPYWRPDRRPASAWPGRVPRATLVNFSLGKRPVSRASPRISRFTGGKERCRAGAPNNNWIWRSRLLGQASGDLEVLLGKAAGIVARQLDDDLAPTHLQVGVMAFRFG